MKTLNNNVTNNANTTIFYVSKSLIIDKHIAHGFCTNDDGAPALYLDGNVNSTIATDSMVELYEQSSSIKFRAQSIEELNKLEYVENVNLIFNSLVIRFPNDDYSVTFNRNSSDFVCFGVERTIRTFNKSGEVFSDYVAGEFLAFIKQLEKAIDQTVKLLDLSLKLKK